MSIFDRWAEYFPQLFGGLEVTLALTGLSLLFGLPVGLLLALAVSSKARPLRIACVTLVEIGRGAPALVVLYMVYFGLPQAGLTWTAMVSAVVAFAWTTAAYTSEILRAGLQSVPEGITEAAAALGMERRDTLQYIIIPQGMRVAIPALMGFAILVFQGTSLAYKISVQELVSQAYSISSVNFQHLAVFTLVGIMYASISIPATWLTVYVEKRMARSA